MPAPMLVPLVDVVQDLTTYPAAWQGAAFVVVGAGAVGARELSVGQVVVCRSPAHCGDVVVLVARGGQGRPRFGRVRGDALFGEAGEPCSPLRWRVAGGVSAVLDGGERLRRLARVWCEGHPDQFWVPPVVRRAAEQPAGEPRVQLGLFQVAA